MENNNEFKEWSQDNLLREDIVAVVRDLRDGKGQVLIYLREMLERASRKGGKGGQQFAAEAFCAMAEALASISVE